jgi:glycosyltransferase involved in cell wall biosynthesis
MVEEITRLMPFPVLYGHSSALIGGGNVVLLRLFSRLCCTPFRPISVVPEQGPLEVQLDRLSVPHTRLDIRPHRKSYGLMTATKLALWSRKHRAALVHANDPGIYRQLSFVQTAGRRICHIHHPDVSAGMLSWSFQRPPTAIVVPTTHVANHVRGCLSPSSRIPIHIIGNPIDTDWFAPPADVLGVRRRLGLSPTAPHISMIASLSRHKGHACFLRMARRIVDAMPDVRFSIVGGVTAEKRDYADEVTALVSALKLNSHVKMWGYVDDPTARDIMAASDLFVLPTKEEGFGLVVAEAQACGVPVLTSNVPPLAEILEDGVTGYCLDSDDDKAFASIALRLLRDPAVRARMSAAGRTFVLDRFDVRPYADRLTQIYDAVISQAQASAA